METIKDFFESKIIDANYKKINILIKNQDNKISNQYIKLLTINNQFLPETLISDTVLNAKFIKILLKKGQFNLSILCEF